MKGSLPGKLITDRMATRGIEVRRAAVLLASRFGGKEVGYLRQLQRMIAGGYIEPNTADMYCTELLEIDPEDLYGKDWNG